MNTSAPPNPASPPTPVVDPRIADELWKTVGPEMLVCIRTLLEHGVAHDESGDRTPEETMSYAMLKVTETAYRAALDRGFELGRTVYNNAKPSKAL